MPKKPHPKLPAELQKFLPKTADFEAVKFEPKAYLDKVGNAITIGYGTNLDEPTIQSYLKGLGYNLKDLRSGKREITKEEGWRFLEDKMATAYNDAQNHFKNFSEQPLEVKYALTDLAYNMGLPKLSTFKKFTKAIENNDYKKAAAELKNSKYYNQTGRRAKAHTEFFNTFKPAVTVSTPVQPEPESEIGWLDVAKSYLQTPMFPQFAAGMAYTKLFGPEQPEQPEKQASGGLIKRKDGSYSRRGLWDNIRANRGSGRKPTKEMLRQEKKIRAAEKKELGGWLDAYEYGGSIEDQKIPSNPAAPFYDDYSDPTLTNYQMGTPKAPMYGPGGKVNTLEGDMIANVLMNRNRNKDFVQRAYALGQNPNGMFQTWDDFDTKASHLMEWGEDESGQAYMYPSILNPGKEAIKVPNQYADYISSVGYKKATGMPMYGPGGKIDLHLDKLNKYKKDSPRITPQGFLVRDPMGLFIGGAGFNYKANDNLNISPYAIGVGNEYFQKFPVDYGVNLNYPMGKINPSVRIGKNPNIGISYKFNNGGFIDEQGEKVKPPFNTWYKTVNPNFADTTAYDLRQAYQNLSFKDLENWRINPDKYHLPDTYKYPNHPTFSDESIYFNPKTKKYAGHWTETDSSWNYVPYDTTFKKLVVEKKGYGGSTDPDTPLTILGRLDNWVDNAGRTVGKKLQENVDNIKGSILDTGIDQLPFIPTAKAAYNIFIEGRPLSAASNLLKLPGGIPVDFGLNLSEEKLRGLEEKYLPHVTNKSLDLAHEGILQKIGLEIADKKLPSIDQAAKELGISQLEFNNYLLQNKDRILYKGTSYKTLLDELRSKTANKKANGGPVKYAAGATVWTDQDTVEWAAGTPTRTTTQMITPQRAQSPGTQVPYPEIKITGPTDPYAPSSNVMKGYNPYKGPMRLHAPDTTVITKSEGSYGRMHALGGAVGAPFHHGDVLSKKNTYNHGFANGGYVPMYKSGGFFRQAGEFAYGVGAGTLNAVTGGLTQPITDMGHDALAEAAGTTYEGKEGQKLKRLEGAGTAVGAVVGGVTTGNVQGAISQGAKGVNQVLQYSPNASEGLKTWGGLGLNLAQTASGFMGSGAGGKGGMMKTPSVSMTNTSPTIPGVDLSTLGVNMAAMGGQVNGPELLQVPIHRVGGRVTDKYKKRMGIPYAINPGMYGMGSYTGELENKQLPATRNDSLMLYNNAIALNKFYQSAGYKQSTLNNVIAKTQEKLKKLKEQWDTDPDPRSLKEAEEKLQHYTKIKKEQETKKNLPSYKEGLNAKKDSYIYDLNNQENPQTYIINNKLSWEDNPKLENYYQKINDYQFKQRELSTGTLNLDAPMPIYDLRITPQYYTIWDNKNKNDWAEIYSYDPLAVKPYIDRTEEEKIEWEKKYGTQFMDMRGVVQKTLPTAYQYEGYTPEQLRKMGYRQPEKKADGGDTTPIYVTDRNDPRLKAYQDSLKLYNKSLKDLKERSSDKVERIFSPNDPLIAPLKDYWKGKIQPISVEQYSGGYEGRGTAFIPRYKKPVQPVVYNPNIPYMPMRGMPKYNVEATPQKVQVDKVPLMPTQWMGPSGEWVDNIPDHLKIGSNWRTTSIPTKNANGGPVYNWIPNYPRTAITENKEKSGGWLDNL
jgi:lysozyme